VREPQRQVGKVNCSETQEFHVTAEFKSQSSNCMAILSGRNIINKRDAGLKGSFSSRFFMKSVYCKLLWRQFFMWPAHPAVFPEKPRIGSCGYAFLQTRAFMADRVPVSEEG